MKKKNKVWIFYHSADSDGMSSGFLMKWAVENGIIIIPRTDAEVGMIPFNYKWDVPFEKISNNDLVFWLDVSATPEEMNTLYDKLDGEMIWIDHHESILKDHFTMHQKCMGYRDFKQAACINVYEFIKDFGKFNKTTQQQFNNIKPLIDIVGACDIWDLSLVDGDRERWNSEYLSVKFALDANDTDPRTKNGYNFWLDFMNADNEDIENMISDLKYDGNVIQSYMNIRNHDLCNSYGFSADFEGIRVFAVNQGIGGSFIFNSINPEKYDAFMCFIKSGKSNQYSVSLYGNNKDINLIDKLKHIGFSGHAQAGGFKCDTFEIICKGIDKKILVS
jgi:hypothetical protein